MRTMTEKIERSVRNANRALLAYRLTGGQDDDDLAAIGDLITDLLHLADKLHGRTNIDALALLSRAEDHFRYESDPAHADEGV